MNKNEVIITGTKLVRNIDNMSLINTDLDELKEYQNRRNFLLKQKNELNTIKQEVSDIKSDISSIKEMLLHIINR
jgi:hypothetical protein